MDAVRMDMDASLMDIVPALPPPRLLPNLLANSSSGSGSYFYFFSLVLTWRPPDFLYVV